MVILDQLKGGSFNEKKIISSLVTFAILLTLAAPAMATNQETSSTSVSTSVEHITDGDAFTLLSEEKAVAILTNNNSHYISAGIRYMDAPSTVYQFEVYNYPEETFSPESQDFWFDVLAFLEDNLDEAEIVTICQEIYDTPTMAVMPRGSVEADFYEQMEGSVGSEYDDMLWYSTTYMGQSIKIYASLQYRFDKIGRESWDKALNVSSIITGILGMVTTSTLIAAICNIWGVAVSASTFIPAGAIDIYRCRAMMSKEATVNGSTYVYNITWKFIDYNGFNNPGDYQARAKIDTGSRSISYPEGEAYFNSNTDQVKDAYAVYQQIGQKA